MDNFLYLLFTLAVPEPSDDQPSEVQHAWTWGQESGGQHGNPILSTTKTRSKLERAFFLHPPSFMIKKNIFKQLFSES